MHTRKLLLALLLSATTACASQAGEPNIVAAHELNTLAGMPDSTAVQLFLLAGQSNMAGRGEVQAIDRQTHPRVFMLTRGGRWMPAREPMHFDKPDRIGVGPGVAFGKALADAYPNAVIGLIPSAVGGSAIASWSPGGYDRRTDTHPFDDAVARVRAAAGTGRLAGILWHQGESDRRPERARVYAQELTRVADQFRQECESPDAVFLAAGLGEFLSGSEGDVQTVQSALENVANDIPDAAFVSAAGLRDKGDRVHFDTESARELGHRYARAFLNLSGGVSQ